MGRISKLFGSQGELVLTLYEGFPRPPKLDKPFYTVVDGLDVPLFAGRFAPRGQSSAVVAFDDIDTVGRASELIGKEIFLPGESGRDGGDASSDLTGYRAILGGGLEGVVEEFFDEGPNPLFGIVAGGRQILVPAAAELISKIDRRRREIRFILPEGLIDLNE